MEILRRCDRGASTLDIRSALDLPESMLRTVRKDREKMTAAFKAGQEVLPPGCRRASTP